MDGIHDLGGKQGFGPVVSETDEPVFHHAWEGRAWALNLLSIGRLRAYNPDAYRHAVERIPPAMYLSATYYERLLFAMTTLLVEAGVVDEASLRDQIGEPPVVTSAVVPAVESLLAKREPPPITSDARYSIGDKVTVTAVTFPGHTRCPAYIRSKSGTIVRVYPLANVPEWRAHSNARCKEHTYAVEFWAADLWPDGEPGSTVVVELFESYLSSEGMRRQA